MRLWQLAAALGLVMGVYSIGMPYVTATYFPSWFTIVGILGGLTIPVAAFWPWWLDGAADGWLRRLSRRAAVLAGGAVVGGIASFLLVTAVPGYLAWGERTHRQHLERQGKPEAEIVAAIEEHRQRPSDFLLEGLLFTAVPGTIAIVLTTPLGALRGR